MARSRSVIAAQAEPIEPPAQQPCDQCGSERTTTIAIKLTDGTPVQFTSCRTCEHKAWRYADGTLALESVLERAQKQH